MCKTRAAEAACRPQPCTGAEGVAVASERGRVRAVLALWAAVLCDGQYAGRRVVPVRPSSSKGPGLRVQWAQGFSLGRRRVLEGQTM